MLGPFVNNLSFAVIYSLALYRVEGKKEWFDALVSY